MMELFISKECEVGAVWKWGWCEHCGDLSLDKSDGATISDGGTYWCEFCWYANEGEFRFPEGLDKVEREKRS